MMLFALNVPNEKHFCIPRHPWPTLSIIALIKRQPKIASEMWQAVNSISLNKARGLIGLHAHQKFKCSIYIYTYYGSPEISGRRCISTWNLQMSFDVARSRTNDKVIVNIRRTHEYKCIRRICGTRTTPGMYGISAEITCARKTFGRSAHNCSLILIYIELILVFISCSLPLSLSCCGSCSASV